jgi:hypothetical protein
LVGSGGAYAKLVDFDDLKPQSKPSGRGTIGSRYLDMQRINLCCELPLARKTNMRLSQVAIISVAIGMVVVGHPGLSQATAPSAWILTVELDNNQLLTGGLLHLNLTLKNVTSTPLKVVDRDELIDYDVFIKDVHGFPVPHNAKTMELIERRRNGPVFHSDLIDVEPGSFAKTSIDAKDLFDPLRPGKYTIQVERIGPLQLQPGRFLTPKGILSNVITFQVLSQAPQG